MLLWLQDHSDRLPDHPGLVQGWESACYGVLGIPLLENERDRLVLILHALYFFSFFVCIFVVVIVVFMFYWLCTIPIFFLRIFSKNGIHEVSHFAILYVLIFTKNNISEMMPWFLIFVEVFL